MILVTRTGNSTLELPESSTYLSRGQHNLTQESDIGDDA
jgi:hypothetical protein